MAKTVSPQKPGKTNAKSPASYDSTKDSKPSPSDKNPSKYAPGQESNLTLQSLDPEDGLLKLFTDGIKDLYWAENQLTKALPKMAKATATPELSQAILTHLEETKNQVTRLENIFSLMDKKPTAKKCDAMEGLTKEGEGIVEDTDADTPARDLGILMASQKVEHYEIASYTGLIKLAGKLGLTEAADLLSESLQEEQAADELLGNIADQIFPVMGEDAAQK